jgi:hypothetical protein
MEGVIDVDPAISCDLIPGVQTHVVPTSREWRE